MGVSIKLPDVTFDPNKVVSSFTIPDRTGLLGEWRFGTDEATTIRNYANAGLPMTKTGSPAFHTNYATVNNSSSSNGFDTAVTCPLNVTMIAVLRLQSGLASILAKDASFNGFVNYSSELSFYNNQAGALDVVANLSNPVHGGFFMVAATGPWAGIGNIYLWTAGVRSSATAEVAGGSSTSNRQNATLKIGHNLASDGSGETDIAWAAVIDGIRSPSNLDTIYASVKAYYSSLTSPISIS